MDQHKDILEIPRRRKPDLILLGDSLFQHWGGEGRRVARGVRTSDYDLYFAPYNTANFGVSGDGTQHVLWRIDNGEFEDVNPKLILIHVGVNNTVHATGEEIAAGIKEIVNRLRKLTPNAKLLIVSPIPAGPDKDHWRRVKLDRASEIIGRYADNKRIFYADLRSEFIEDDGKLIEADYSSDSIHLSKPGFAKMGKVLADPVRRLMR
jgi:lysophospholipase L1-like esterase